MLFDIDIYKDSIINPKIDQMQIIYGNADVNDSGDIKIYNNTKIRYSYDFDYVTSLKTSQLIISYNIVNSLGISMLFDHNIFSINLYIKYYKKTDDGTLSNDDGSLINVKFIPPVIRGSDYIIDTNRVDIEDWYIKKLIIDIEFKGNINEYYVIKNLTLKRLKTTSEEISSTVKWSPVADSITIRPNGYEIKFDSNDSMTLLIDTDVVNNVTVLKQVIINSTQSDERIIPINYSSVPIPKNTV